MQNRTFIQRSLQRRNQTPIPSPLLPAILDCKPLILSLFRPKAKVQQVHGEDKVDRRLILALRVQLVVVRPALRGEMLDLRLAPHKLGRGLRAAHVEHDIDAVVEDVLCALQHLCFWRRGCGLWSQSQVRA